MPVPTGLVGPLRVQGEHAQGACYLPLATTERSLVAGYNRGANVTSAAGGIVTVVGRQSAHRAPGSAWTATAEIGLPAKLVGERLRTTPGQMSTFWAAGSAATFHEGSLGVSGRIANGLAALFLACGQDVASISDVRVDVTRFDVTSTGDLRCTITLANLIVGTVGGGTQVPGALDGLRMVGCDREGSAPRLAELCAALSLAGEISIAASQCAGDFACSRVLV